MMRVKKAAILPLLIAVFSASLHATDWQSHVKKTWEFKLHQGLVKVVLLVDPSFPDVSTLELLYEGEAHPSLAEEVGFIRDVVHQLPALGIDPLTVRAISMRGFAEPDVKQRVAIAALHSKMWQSRAKLGDGAEQVTEHILNSIGAYDSFSGAFAVQGLVVEVQGVEKVVSARCGDLQVPDPVCRAHPNLQVPVGANFRLSLVRKTGRKPGTTGEGNRGQT